MDRGASNSQGNTNGPSSVTSWEQLLLAASQQDQFRDSQ